MDRVVLTQQESSAVKSALLTTRYDERMMGGGCTTARQNDESSTTQHRMNMLADTDWSLLDRAVIAGDAGSDAMEAVSRRYWPVVYGYARACGCDVHQAGDITQGFLCEKVLTGKLLESADPQRGRFRNLLRTAVQHYVATQQRRRYGRSRFGREEDGVGGDDRQAADRANLAPEAEFDAQWAAALIRRVLQDVRRHYISHCQDAHWEIFVGRVVRPMLFDEPPTPYEQLVRQFELSDAAQASNMMITVKRKFARAMRTEVGRTVTDPGSVEEELRELMASLERGSLR